MAFEMSSFSMVPEFQFAVSWISFWRHKRKRLYSK